MPGFLARCKKLQLKHRQKGFLASQTIRHASVKPPVTPAHFEQASPSVPPVPANDAGVSCDCLPSLHHLEIYSPGPMYIHAVYRRASSMSAIEWSAFQRM